MCFRFALSCVARPKKDPDERRRSLSIRLAPDLHEWVDEISGPGKKFHNKTHVIERALKKFREELEDAD